MPVLQRQRPALGGLDRVGRAEHKKMRDRAQRGEVLDRLMRRTVLAETDRVVRHYIDDAGLHQRRQTDRRAGVIGEGQERAAIGNEPAMHGDAVHRGAHPMLADAEMDIAAGEIAGLDVGLVLGLGVVRRGQVGRAADQLRHRRHQRVEHLARGLTGSDLRVLGAEIVANLGDRRVEPLRQLASLAALELAAPVGGAAASRCSQSCRSAEPRDPACRHSA